METSIKKAIYRSQIVAVLKENETGIPSSTDAVPRRRFPASMVAPLIGPSLSLCSTTCPEEIPSCQQIAWINSLARLLSSVSVDLPVHDLAAEQIQKQIQVVEAATNGGG